MQTLGVNKGLSFGSASLQIAAAVTPIESLESPEGPAFNAFSTVNLFVSFRYELLSHSLQVVLV